MRDRYRWLGVALSFLLVGQTSAWGNVTMEPRQAIEGTVRFDLYWDYLIVAKGSVGPLKGLTFLIDTGASPSVIDPWIARKLHLEQHTASIRTVGGMVTAARAIVPSLSLGPVRREDFSVSIEDLSFMQKTLPVRLDGIIGLDVLGQSAFLIDYKIHSIHFGSSPWLPDSIPLVSREGLAFVQADLNGAPAQLLLDTGTGSLTIFARNAKTSAVGLKTRAVPSAAAPIGEFAHQQVTLHSLRLGAAEFRRQSLSIVSGSGNPGYGFDGMLSPAAMGLRRIAIDLGRGEMAFSR